MFTLKWKHTRTGREMTKEFATYGQAWIHVTAVREIFPDHKFTINGRAI